MTNSTVFIQCNTSSSASLLPSSKMPSPPNANIRQQQPPPPQSTPSLFFQIHRNYLCQIVELLRTNTIMQPKLSTTSTIKNRSIQSQDEQQVIEPVNDRLMEQCANRSTRQTPPSTSGDVCRNSHHEAHLRISSCCCNSASQFNCSSHWCNGQPDNNPNSKVRVSSKCCTERRPWWWWWHSLLHHPLATIKPLTPSSSLFITIFLLCSLMLHTADSCSSRSTPKPRPPTPTTRPNITFQTYACPEAYAKWYCLNGATCFSVRIGESILYNCECADGYMGQRCEFKDLDGSYLPSREKILVETAGIAGGVTLAVLLVVVISISYYTYLRNNNHIRAAPTLRGYRRQVDTTVTVDEETGAGAADVVPFYRHASYYQHYSTFSPTATKYGACGGDSMLPPSLANGTATSQPQHCLACMSQLTGKPSPLSNKAQHILDLENGKNSLLNHSVYHP